MMRPIYLSFLLLAISIVCMGQTFQYSRGWTNGKRVFSTSRSAPGHFHQHGSTGFSYEAQINERHLEECLQKLKHLLCNPLDTHYFGKLAAGNTGGAADSGSNSKIKNNNRNNLSANNNQSNELFEDDSGEHFQSDYVKH